MYIDLHGSPELAFEEKRTAAKLSGILKTLGYDVTTGVGGTGVIYVLHDVTNPEAYGGLPSNPRIPWVVKFWKGPLKWIGNLAMIGGVIGVTLHYLRFGPKQVEPEKNGEGRP